MEGMVTEAGGRSAWRRSEINEVRQGVRYGTY